MRCSRAAGRVVYANFGLYGGVGAWTQRLDGSDVRELTVAEGVVRAASWSPDGARLVVELGSTSSRTLATMNADGTGLTLLASNVFTTDGPSWSPDGREILFSGIGPFQIRPIRVIDVATRVIRTIAEDGHAPRWSPDGQWIAFADRASPFAVRLVNRTGDSTRVLVAREENPGPFVWTDDGRILYEDRSRVYLLATVDGVKTLAPSGWISHSHAHWCGTP